MNKLLNKTGSLSVLFLSLFVLLVLAMPVSAVPATFPGCPVSSATAECVVGADVVVPSSFNNAVFQYNRFVINPSVAVTFDQASGVENNGANITILAKQIIIGGRVNVDGEIGELPWTVHGGRGGSLTLIAKNELFLGAASVLSARGGDGSTLDCLAGNGGNGGRIALRTVSGASVSTFGQFNVSNGFGAIVPDTCTSANGTNGAVGVVESTTYVPSLTDFALYVTDRSTIRRAEEGVGLMAGRNVSIMLNGTDEFGDYIAPSSASWSLLNSTVATLTQLNTTHALVIGARVGETNATVTVNGIARTFSISVITGVFDHIAVSYSSNTTLSYGQLSRIYVTGFDVVGNRILIPLRERNLIDFSIIEGSTMGGLTSCLSTPACTGVFPNGYPINFEADSKPGTATVNITYGSQSFNITFNVYMPTSAVASVRISPLTPSVASGSTTTFTLIGIDADGDEASFPATSWTTSNVTGSGTIDVNGTFIARLPGYVTVTGNLGSRSNSTNVTIVLGQVHHFDISGLSTVVAGQAISFNATLQDSANNNLSNYNGQAPQVVWSTSSGTIYPNGTLVATTAGNVNVTATLLQNPAIRGSRVVLVTPGDAVSLAVAENGAGIQVGSTYALTASLVDKYGNRVADTDATWIILNATGSATLSGRLITPTRVGYVTVHAVSITNSSLTAIGILTITAGQPTSISIAPPSASIRPGNTVRFSVTAYDAFGNSYVYLNSSWSVSNTGIATISSDGTFTALREGSVTVTATAGPVSKSVTVIVLQSLDQQAQVAAQFATPIATITVPGQQPRVSINTGSGNGNAGGLSGFFTAGAADSEMILLGVLALLLVGMVAYWATARNA